MGGMVCRKVLQEGSELWVMGEEWSMCRCVGKVGNVGTGSKVV